MIKVLYDMNDVFYSPIYKSDPSNAPRSVLKQQSDQSLSIHPIIDNVNHLKKIVMLHGKSVFKSKTVHDEILLFIIENFIEKPFLYNGKVIGSTQESDIGQYDDDPMYRVIWKRQREQIMKFWDLFVKHFSNGAIRDPTDKADTIMGEGTYGTLLPYYNHSVENKSKLIKYMTPSQGNYHMNMNTHIEANYSWFVEFCTFVVVMAILIYIDCNFVINESKRGLCVTKRYQNIFEVPHIDSALDISDTTEQFLSYYSFMAKIDVPFVNQTTTNDEYVLGYIVEAYQNTIYDLYRSLDSDKQKFIDAFNLTYQIFEIINKMNHLTSLGIVVSHRDITAKNIMYSQDPLKRNRFKLRLIDFGFMCSSIRFKDGKSVVIGYHPFESRNDLYLCNKPFLDIVLFISWCLRYNQELFKNIKSYTGINAMKRFYDIITLNNSDIAKIFEQKNKKQEWELSVWDYSAALDKIVEKLIEDKKISPDNRLDTKRIEKIFIDVFAIMDEIRGPMSDISIQNLAMDHEKDTCKDTETDTETDTGVDTETDTGVDTETDTGVDTETGTDTGTDTGADFREVYEENKEAYHALIT